MRSIILDISQNIGWVEQLIADILANIYLEATLNLFEFRGKNTRVCIYYLFVEFEFEFMQQISVTVDTLHQYL